MRIGVLSYNVDKLNKDPNIDDTSVIDLHPDIYVEMTQEDSRKPNGDSLLSSNILKTNGYDILETVSLNSGKSSQNVIMNLYKREDSSVEVIDKGAYPVSPKKGYKNALIYAQSFLGYTKGMVYIKVVCESKTIIFVNMHLPIDTTEKGGKLVNSSMGLNYRTDVMNDLLNKLNKDDTIDYDPIIFIGGDLNFRMDYNGKNQLTNLLKSNANNFQNIREFSFPNNSKKLTCKFNRGNRSCRTRKIPKNNVEVFLKKVQQNCGDKSRIPSRCDRFLIKTTDTTPTPLLHTAKYLLPKSDHNGLLICFDI